MWLQRFKSSITRQRIKMDLPELKVYVNAIEEKFQSALTLAIQLQAHIEQTEGDSDLHRKIAYYLVPNLNHWINGSQTGNIKDLNELIGKRKK